VTESNPAAYMQGAGSSHSALLFRRVVGMILGEGIGAYNTSQADGVKASILADDLKVVQNSPLGMTVLVKRGAAAIRGDSATDQGIYTGYNDADEAQVIDPVSANPRIDLIVAQIDDTFYGGPDDVWQIAVVKGTENAVPTAPAVPASALLLAEVRVNVGTTEITDSLITDKRVPAAPVAGGQRAIFAAVYRGADKSISNDTNTLVDFDTEEADDFGFWVIGTPTRLTIPTGFDGVFRPMYSGQFPGHATGIRFFDILKNGSLYARSTSNNLGSTRAVARQVVGRPSKCVAGDYFEARVLQTSGGALVLDGGAHLNAFSVIREGRS
jgi:hypothetical protein